MENIGIFCSASNNIDPVFFRHACELGKWMGENKKTLIYGGALWIVCHARQRPMAQRLLGLFLPEYMKWVGQVLSLTR